MAPGRLPANTRVTTWQWEAALVQLPGAESERIARSFADATLRIDPKVNINVGDVADDNNWLVRSSSDTGNHRFVFEISRFHVIYHHEPTRSNKVADPVGDHIHHVALPFLRQFAADAQISGRFTATGVVYELTSTLKRTGRANKQLVIDRLIGGLRSRPWESRLSAAPQALERIELKWATSTTVLGEKVSLWIKVDCPTNDAHSTIGTTFVLKSAANVLPSNAWAAAADKVHDATWQVAVDFMTWLFSHPR